MSHIFRETEHLLNRINLKISDIYDNPMEEYGKVMTCQNFSGMMEQLYKMLAGICTYVKANSGETGVFVRQAKRYIETHFSDSGLSLDLAASNVGISAPYLSTLFKKEEWVSFVSYLTRIRIEKAEELLKQGKLRSYEIAEKCGYANSTYFSSIFKKHTGMSPSEYRQKCRVGD